MFSALIRWLAFSKPSEPIRPVPTPDGFNGFAQTHPFPWPEGDSDAGFLGNDGRLMATLHNLGRLGTEVSAFLVMPVLGFPELPEGSRLLSHEDTPVSLTVTPVDIPADLRCLLKAGWRSCSNGWAGTGHGACLTGPLSTKCATIF